MPVYMWICRFGGSHVSAKYRRRLGLNVGFFLDGFQPFIVWQGLTLNPELTVLTSLGSQLVLGIPCLCLQSLGFTSDCHTHLAFMWVLAIQTLVLIPMKKAFYSLSPPLASLTSPTCGNSAFQISLVYVIFVLSFNVPLPEVN